MKKLIQTILFILFGVVASTLMGFIIYEHGHQNINEIKIKISKTDNGGFLSEESIINIIKEIDSIKTKKINDLEINLLEKLVSSNPFVNHVDAYININKDLIINIEEREALLRIYLPDNSSFYIDKNGNLFPLCNRYTPRLIIANGYINTHTHNSFSTVTDTLYTETELPEIFQLTKKISNNSFLKAQISQIYVNSIGEYDLIPELGSHTIRLGNINNIDEKLRNLESFYKKKLVNEGWEKYETINFTYKNQIVCTKK